MVSNQSRFGGRFANAVGCGAVVGVGVWTGCVAVVGAVRVWTGGGAVLDMCPACGGAHMRW
eukprot:12892253-Prorocentrum_lima.AAC.1